MIISKPSEFPEGLIGQPVVIDVETTSFDDKKEGFNPYQGCRVAGYAFGPKDSEETYYLPIRHSNGTNVELEPSLKFVRDMISKAPQIVNHNIKFDVKFWRHDGCNDTCQLSDTMILARLVHNDLFSYSLDSLGALFLKEAKDERVKEYMKKIKSKDYGACPIELMGPYAEKDIDLTRRLFHKLSKMLPAESAKVWENEQRLTRILVESEHRGIRVDRIRLLKQAKANLMRLIQITEELSEIAGFEVDPKKRSHITEVLHNRGIQPKEFTKTGLPKWDSNSLKSFGDEAADLFNEYSHVEHINSTYCTGWVDKMGDDGRLHADFRISGTGTGRLSAANPNVQNMPEDAQLFVIPDDGEVICLIDYSQIEYRIFAHYTQDEKLIAQYAENPHMDFHQALADSLKIPRQSAKTLNFGFIYGMGKRKLLASLAAEGLPEEVVDEYTTSDPFASEIERLESAAQKIWGNYHARFPAIKKLQRRVTNKINNTKTLRNYMGRIYRWDDTRWSYKGLNYLCQGTAADIFKDRLIAVSERFPELNLFTNVHDSGVWSVRPEFLIENFGEITEILEDVQPPLRVPLFVEAKIGPKNMAEATVVNNPSEIEDLLAA